MIYLATILISVGLIIRIVSIVTLGEMWSLCIKKPSGYVETGIYKYIRHPSYVGSFFVFLGLAIISLSLCVMYLTFVFFLSRAVEEESLMDNIPGYSEYKKRTGMFIPRLRRKRT